MWTRDGPSCGPGMARDGPSWAIKCGPAMAPLVPSLMWPRNSPWATAASIRRGSSVRTTRALRACGRGIHPHQAEFLSRWKTRIPTWRFLRQADRTSTANGPRLFSPCAEDSTWTKEEATTGDRLPTLRVASGSCPCGGTPCRPYTKKTPQKRGVKSFAPPSGHNYWLLQ